MGNNKQFKQATYKPTVPVNVGSWRPLWCQALTPCSFNRVFATQSGLDANTATQPGNTATRYLHFLILTHWSSSSAAFVIHCREKKWRMTQRQLSVR